MKLLRILSIVCVLMIENLPSQAMTVGVQIGGVKKLLISNETSSTEIRRSRNAPKTKGCVGPAVSDNRITQDALLPKNRSRKGLKGLLKKLFSSNPRTKTLPY